MSIPKILSNPNFNMVDSSSLKQRGRKSIEIIFPSESFTINSLSELYPKVSKGCLQQKVHLAMNQGLLVEAGREESMGKGRKGVIYNKSNALKVAESLVQNTL